MAEQYWRRIRGNPGELPKLAILPTQLTPGNQKLWWDAFVVKKNASVFYAATKCYSTKQRLNPSPESLQMYGGGSAFDLVAAYVRGRVDQNEVEKAVEQHCLHLLSIGRNRTCLEAVEAVVFNPEKNNWEEAISFYIDLATASTADQEKIFVAWFTKLVKGRTEDSIASLKELLGVDVEGTAYKGGEDAKRGLLHCGDPGRAYLYINVSQTEDEMKQAENPELEKTERDPIAKCIQEFF